MNSIDEALARVHTESAAPALEKQALSSLVSRPEASSCEGLAEKLTEYAHARSRLEDLIAEIRLGLALTRVTKHLVTFQSGAQADLRLGSPELDCTIEVEHKSTTSAFAAVFYPGPDLLKTYRGAQEAWKASSVRLHDALGTLAVEVRPWLDGAISEPNWAGEDRAKQEERCGELAEWLAERLLQAGHDGPRTVTHALARFDIRPLATPPGWIAGYGPLNAYSLRMYPHRGSDDPRQGPQRETMSGWLARAIKRKSKKAADHPERCGHYHLIGLVIDDPFAQPGEVLTNTFYGGLVAAMSEGGNVRCYRPVPLENRALVIATLEGDQKDLAHALHYDPAEVTSNGGLIFDDNVRNHIDGIVALYGDDQLELLPNIFSARASTVGLSRVFPRTLVSLQAR